jgi:hypothetical protein
MLFLIPIALLSILLPFGGGFILSVGSLSLFKPKTRLAVAACFLFSAVAVTLCLLWWVSTTAFYRYSTLGPFPWVVGGPAFAGPVIGFVAAAFTVAAIRGRLTGAGPGRPLKKTLVTVLVALLFGAMAVLLGGWVYLERDTWISSHRLSNALRNARAVTFVEFTPAREGGLFELARKAATPEEIARFRSATSPWFLPFGPRSALCSEPHHRVEIVRADGTELTFYVCFLCLNFFLDPWEQTGGSSIELPPPWERSLSSFFASIGMAPKTDDEYDALDHTEISAEEAKAKRWKSIEESAPTFGGSCYELGVGYENGELGAPDPVKAREYFVQGARLNSELCWEKLADYCRRGLGGPQDEAEAYYWISLVARCVNPDSFGGKETWKVREEIAQHLPLPALELAWQRTDDFMAQVAANKITLESPPFLHGLIDPKEEAEGRRAAQKHEDEHRKQLRARGAQPTLP